MAGKKNRIEFRISAPGAETVLLSGNFNNWSQHSDFMKKDQTGTWKKIKMLSQGTYEYKFIVDGTWTLDPNCSETACNQYGTYNNIIEI
ncbi:MAG: glycogen-binding domain-containing protein [Desulfatiglandaceae bacterium]